LSLRADNVLGYSFIEDGIIVQIQAEILGEASALFGIQRLNLIFGPIEEDSSVFRYHEIQCGVDERETLK
jgi:hypothetical protein